MTTQAMIADELPWYRLLSRSQWSTLIAANLGWTFDGYETYAVVLVNSVALRQLLDPSQYSQIPVYAGTVIALTLLGWGVGGLIGGVLADYLGRKRTMMLAILAYSIMTGLSAFAWDWLSFAVLRFLVGIAIGSEWVTGASIVAELWPDRARGRGVGLMQCGFGIGFFVASSVWLFVAAMGPDAWRYMFIIGVLPALMTLWVRRSIPESERWEQVRARRRAAVERKRTGAALGEEERALARITVVDLFADRTIRRRIVLAFLMSLATTLAYWGMGAWIPPFVGAAAANAGLNSQQWVSYAGAANAAASLIGFTAFGFLADVFGRKPVMICYVVAAFFTVPLMFVWAQDLSMMLVAAALSGVFVIGQFTWMAAWLPELFPTRMRATAAGFVFNTPRLIAWLGPFISGWIIANLGGFSHAAMTIALTYFLSLAAAVFLPETKGQPLPA
jgi:MFS family permease